MGHPQARSRALAAVIWLCAALAIPASSHAEPLIQPGAPMSSPAGSCTLNFVFADAAKLYVGTAGHCSNAVGDRVRDESGAEFGTVVFREFVGVGADDFSLIRIDAGRYGDVVPEVRRWTGPTAVAVGAAIGDRLLLHGYGLGFGETPTTRSRYGVLTSDNHLTYTAELPTIFGDSGGPVVRATDGSALGIVSGIALGGTHTLTGPTVERILARLAASGFEVRLVTAPFATKVR